MSDTSSSSSSIRSLSYSSDDDLSSIFNEKLNLHTPVLPIAPVALKPKSKAPEDIDSVSDLFSDLTIDDTDTSISGTNTSTTSGTSPMKHRKTSSSESTISPDFNKQIDDLVHTLQDLKLQRYNLRDQSKLKQAKLEKEKKKQEEAEWFRKIAEKKRKRRSESRSLHKSLSKLRRK